MSTDDFTTRLGAQLYEAALRDERRGSLGSRLAQLRYAMPRTAAVAAGALAVLAIAAVIAIGGLNWGSENTVTTPKVIRTFGLADNLGTMTTGFGAVWAVDSAEGRILRVDPRTRQVQQRIPSSPDAIVNAGAGAVWAINPIGPTGNPSEGAHLLRIDPSSGRVTSRVHLRAPGGGEFAAADVVFARGVPWVIGAPGAVRIDPVTGRPDDIVRVSPADGDPFPLWSSIAEDGLWILSREGRIVRYDLETSRVTQLLPSRLSGARALTPTPSGPVLVSPFEVARMNPRNGTMDWRIPLELSFPPAVEGNLLLAHARGGTTGGRDRLVALDVATGKLRYAVTLPEFGITGATNVGRQIWIATPNGKVVVVQR